MLATQIALFNHKGGVSKTTTTFNLGWMLASLGHRVILVDADPQCNLSGLILGFRGEQDFEDFYQREICSNIRDGLAPAFESQPRPIAPVDVVAVCGCEGLFLLPGHIRLSEYEVTLGIAQELSGSIQALQNLPGSLSHLLALTAERLEADLILVDMNPSLNSINQNLLMTSDFFLIPTSPDYFSVMAIESLSTILPRWREWATRASENPVLRDAAYPFPRRTPRFLGTVIQNYRPRKGAPTVGFQQWIHSINTKVSDVLVPTLSPIGMVLPDEAYASVDGLVPSLCLALIADFNTLIAKSQEHQTPVFALSDEQIAHVGTVLAANQEKRQQFREVFQRLATNVMTLVSNAE